MSKLCHYKIKLKKDILTLYVKRKDTYRIKEEVTLPGTKETIGTMLWTDIQNRKLNTKLEMDEFVLQGEIQVFCPSMPLKRKSSPSLARQS